MKIWTSKYRSHWISPYTILEKVYFWREIDYDEPRIKQLSNWLSPFCEGVQWFLDRIHPRFEYVKIDHYDTWSMDHTLATVILPMLKQLKATKHGSAMVDDEDVPPHLQSAGYKKSKKKTPRAGGRTISPDVHAIDSENDDTIHERWDWVLSEEIWAFEQMLDDEKGEGKFWDHSECRGLPWADDYVSPKCDWDGLKAHQERMQNGFRLFGKYYLCHWD
jgi:hypothetical protein